MLGRLTRSEAEIEGGAGLRRYGVGGGRAFVARVDGAHIQGGCEIAIGQARGANVAAQAQRVLQLVLDGRHGRKRCPVRGRDWRDVVVEVRMRI